MSMITFYLLWWLNRKLRDHINDQSRHGVRSAHMVCGGTDICSCILPVCFCYSQGVVFDCGFFPRKFIKKSQRYYRRGISNNVAFRKHHISAALCVYRPRGERNVWTSCYRKEHTMRRRLVTQTVTGLNFSDTLEYAVNQEIDRFYY